MKNKQFTTAQENRLAKPGYWVEDWRKTLAKSFDVVLIHEGRCMFWRKDWGWNKLTWTCAPTKKSVLKKPHPEMEWRYYETLEELQKDFPEVNDPFVLGPGSNVVIESEAVHQETQTLLKGLHGHVISVEPEEVIVEVRLGPNPPHPRLPFDISELKLV